MHCLLFKLVKQAIRLTLALNPIKSHPFNTVERVVKHLHPASYHNILSRLTVLN